MISRLGLMAAISAPLLMSGCISYSRGNLDATEVRDVRMRMTTLEDRMTRLEQKVDGLEGKKSGAAVVEPVDGRIEMLEKRLELLNPKAVKE